MLEREGAEIKVGRGQVGIALQSLPVSPRRALFAKRQLVVDDDGRAGGFLVPGDGEEGFGMVGDFIESSGTRLGWRNEAAEVLTDELFDRRRVEIPHRDNGHQVGAVSRGRIVPKFRGDLLEAAVCARGMLDGDVESIHLPENCLDVAVESKAKVVLVWHGHMSDVPPGAARGVCGPGRGVGRRGLAPRGGASSVGSARGDHRLKGVASTEIP